MKPHNYGRVPIPSQLKVDGNEGNGWKRVLLTLQHTWQFASNHYLITFCGWRPKAAKFTHQSPVLCSAIPPNTVRSRQFSKSRKIRYKSFSSSTSLSSCKMFTALTFRWVVGRGSANLYSNYFIATAQHEWSGVWCAVSDLEMIRQRGTSKLVAK